METPAPHTSSFWLRVGLRKDRDYVIENLSMLVAAGMPVARALTVIEKEIRSRRMKAILRVIRQDVTDGAPLWQALESSNLFKDHTLSLVRLGEESGRLVDNLKVISVEEQKARVFQEKIQSAVMYPLFVMSVTVAVGIGIAWFILPRLALVFSQLKIPLPLITKLLIASGAFFTLYGYIVVPGVLFLGVGIAYVAFFNHKTKGIGQELVFHIPGIQILLKDIEVSRFGYLLGTLLHAGVPITQALDSVASATDMIRYQRFYISLSRSLKEGYSFEQSFSQSDQTNQLLPESVQELLITAEQSATLADMLLSIGSTYERMADTMTNNLSVMLEPILLVLVWVGVVSVALAVILPIYGLVGGLSS